MDPAIPLLGQYPKESKAGVQRGMKLHAHVHSRITHKSRGRGATWESVHGWADKEEAAHTGSGILFSLKDKGSSDICYMMVREISQPKKKRQILPDPTSMRRLKQSDSWEWRVEWWFPGAQGRRSGAPLFEGTEFKLCTRFIARLLSHTLRSG